MNKFMALIIFTKVAESGGFTAAARKLGMSVSAVTKAIARLEDDLGTQLFHRTTRQLSTTDYGQEFYERSVQILADLEDAETQLRNRNATARGRVRVVVPISFGRVTLVPELPRFFARYPDIELDISFSDSPVDLIAEGFDVAVRTGHVSDSRLTIRLLTRGPQLVVASPDYIARHGVPRTPEDLQEHNCLVGRFGPDWEFRDLDGRIKTVRVKGNAVINSGDALREAAVTGLGIMQGTLWLVRKDLGRGRLVPLLSEYCVDGVPISVLYLGKKHLPRKVRIFIDFLISLAKNEELPSLPAPALQPAE
ncbi:LysR family transcriptional regulator [Pseudochelatococcus sp. B33]